MEQDPYPFTSVVDAQRFASLTAEIRCVVCQNQSIAESNAPLANDLRGKVYLMVKEQQSAEEIKNYLVQRYGEFILLQPRFNSATFLLWSFPIFALGVAVFILFRLARR
jgi:cytochrome c-type biogenesis protein CcmH